LLDRERTLDSKMMSSGGDSDGNNGVKDQSNYFWGSLRGSDTRCAQNFKVLKIHEEVFRAWPERRERRRIGEGEEDCQNDFSRDPKNRKRLQGAVQRGFNWKGSPLDKEKIPTRTSWEPPSRGMK